MTSSGCFVLSYQQSKTQIFNLQYYKIEKSSKSSLFEIQKMTYDTFSANSLQVYFKLLLNLRETRFQGLFSSATYSSQRFQGSHDIYMTELEKKLLHILSFVFSDVISELHCVTCSVWLFIFRLPSSAKQPVLQPLSVPGAPGSSLALPAPSLRLT